MAAMARETTVDGTCDALLRCSDAFAATLRQVGDPTRPAVGVWNIAETAVHVSQSAPYFLAAARSEAEPEDLDENAAATREQVRAEQERRLDVLADRIVRGERELVRYARTLDGDPTVAPFRRVTMPLSAMLAVELGELLVHGWDVARASELPWHIDPADAATALDGSVHVLPALVDPEKSRGVRLSCELRVRHGRRWLLVVQDGALTVPRERTGRIDCHASVDPVAFLLVSFNRTSPVRAMTTGKIVIWGRRPWAFPRLQRVLKPV